MHNFFRAVRIAFRYPGTLSTSIICSLLVAVIWGGNIGTLFPIIKVTFQGRSLHEWVDSGIAEATTAQEQLRTELEQLEKAPAGEKAKPDHRQRRRAVQNELTVQQDTIDRFQTLKPYVHRLLPDDPFQTVLVIVSVLLVTTGLKGGFLLGSVVTTARLVQKVTLELRNSYFKHVLKMDPVMLGRHGTGTLLTLCNEGTDGIGNGLRCLLGVGVREPLKMFVCAVGAAWISWQLLLFTCLLVPLAALVSRALAHKIRRECKRELHQGVQLNNHVLQAFDGLQTVQAYNMEEPTKQRFHDVNVLRNRKALRIVLLQTLAKPIAELLGIAAVSLAILAGAYLVLNDTTHLFGIRMFRQAPDVETLLLFYALLLGVSEPSRKLSEVFSGIQQGCAMADRFYDIVDAPSDIVEPEEPVALPTPHRSIAYRDVNFAYNPAQPVLRDIDLTVNFGETLAIIGPNGCGKSTLAQMIPRFLDPVSGSVSIDGIDVRQTELADLRRRIGMVTQKTILFDETVLENIRYGSPDATREQVYAAARRARAHDFIQDSLQDGYDTVVGRFGGMLSGGQRQRIALSRALLRDPEILILDEATSEIDLQSELLIHQALEELPHDRTMIIVTHRVGALDLADRIVVMDAGRIVDVGTHAELLGRCEYYRHFRATVPEQAA
ncbi:MAG: ABC transporter ATP-binding protein [Planctomycetota bacterium]|nr:MAG: ABC transporter ATP-binding protein [Planctomycetota bacterium]REJ94154.1 MAG: ABC transporter ATP-binding protein [Planctomycetota bacterium]REK26340.1 MAG: ABC transporter ATP-binding protein [Planctomycetota bacterium]REK45891.1 MAG: ABC transporter ATP-binding protein [Planctomycetota bacterium]